MGSNGIGHLYGELDEGSIEIRKEVGASSDESGTNKKRFSDEGPKIKSPLDCEDQQKSLEQQSSILDISRAEEVSAGSSRRKGEYVISCYYSSNLAIQGVLREPLSNNFYLFVFFSRGTHNDFIV